MSREAFEHELAELVAGFRAHLSWHARAGTYAAPAGPSPRAPVVTAGGGAAESLGGDRLDVDVIDQPDDAEIEAADALAAIRADLGDCERCKLHKSRNKIVFGVGAANADLIFVGEAPGADEDRRGEPFVGRAGQLLDKMIVAMGWTRETVYIANVLKCRPPQNRNPQPDEIAACESFVARQIRAIAPKVIVTLGKPAAHLLLGTTAPISALRGRFQEYRGFRVMPTFHPAYLLRSPERKRDTWEDLKQVIAELERLGVTPPHPPKG